MANVRVLAYGKRFIESPNGVEGGSMNGEIRPVQIVAWAVRSHDVKVVPEPLDPRCRRWNCTLAADRVRAVALEHRWEREEVVAGNNSIAVDETQIPTTGQSSAEIAHGGDRCHVDLMHACRVSVFAQNV